MSPIQFPGATDSSPATSGPNRARRAILAYLIVLVSLEAPVVWWTSQASLTDADLFIVLLMVVPTVSAVVARLITGQRIVFGRPNLKTLGLSMLPALAVGLVYAIALFGLLDRGGDGIGVAEVAGLIVGSTALALGEEIGWRGYLLPQLRRRSSYLKANSIVAIVWLAYHLPIIFIPGVYSNTDIPLGANLIIFTISIFGFSFFVGALWELHHDVWSAGLAHGSWNALLQSVWPAIFMSSNPWLMSEFGLLPMFTMIVIGGAAAYATSKTCREPLRNLLYPTKGRSVTPPHPQP